MGTSKNPIGVSRSSLIKFKVYNLFGFVICLCLSMLSCGEKNTGSAPPPEIPQLVLSSGDIGADGESYRPVLYVLIAASDTCRDSRLRRTYAAGKTADSAAADRAGALEEFLSRQKSGTLYSDIVIHTLVNQKFTKSEFLDAFYGIKAEIKTSDVFILYFSAYSGIDRKDDLFIIPWDGKNNSRKRNISLQDIAKNITTFSTDNALILADTNRSELDARIPNALNRFSAYTLMAETPGQQPLLVMRNGSAAVLMKEFENEAAERRYVELSNFLPDTTANFLILDRWLEPGVLQISALFPGTVTVTGSSGIQENFSLDSFEGAVFQLLEGTYLVNIVYRNSHRENRTVELQNNSIMNISFTYRPNLSARSFSGALPAFGVNIAELNPVNYRKIDKNVLSTMGMEQSRISFLAAELFYKNGEYDKAIAEYNVCISLNVNYADAYTGRGSAYRKKGNYSRAIDDYSLALRYGGTRPEVYNYRGYAYAERGETEKALADFSQALRLKPDYTDAYINRAHAYFETGNYDRAIDDYTQVIRLEPLNASAWNRRGSAWYGKAENDKAIADFTRAIAIKPDYALAWHNRGNVFYNQGDYEKALADLNQTIKLSPSPEAYTSRENILQKLGDTAREGAD